MTLSEHRWNARVEHGVHGACRRNVEALRAEGVQVLEGLLPHVSPLSWEHTGLTGDYVWRPEAVADQGVYRILRVQNAFCTRFFLSV